ncbi:CHAD domain-containing protein [Oricola sp.]|uniref:CHAD domain-containing protein n=1 Tax=Oricola sp. TaxID=1979950 RepID=UPI003BAC1A67
MSYRIRPGLDLTGEVARIAQAQYGKAIDILKTERGGRHEAIHDARKRFKRLRGLLRLVRAGDPEFCLAENARLRDTAGTLSVVRDATALVETMDRLYGTAQPADDLAVLLAVRHRLAERRDTIAASETGLDEKIADAIAECRAGTAALASLSLPKGPNKSAKLLAAGFAKTYGRACTSFEAAEQSGIDEDWHDLRKRIKYHWMHSNLLREVWPGQMRLRAAVADRAGEALGEDHDLSVLGDLIDAAPGEVGNAREIAVVRAVIAKESARLREEFRTIAADLLRDPKDLVKSRFIALWNAAAAAES